MLLSTLCLRFIGGVARLGLKSTELAHAQVGTIRLKLPEIGAVVTRNTRRVRIWFSSAFALKDLFKFCLAYFYG
jgi:Transposase DDE domain group 1